MAHMVEKMMYRKTEGLPWHTLGVPVQDDDIYDIEKCIDHSGLNWSVVTAPLYTKVKMFDELSDSYIEVHSGKAIDCRLATIRSDNKAVLGSVGPRYVPLQNRAAFDFFKPFLDERLASLDTAGSLDEGRKVWVLSKLSLDDADILPGDTLRKYILLSNSHDGTNAIRVGFTPIRVVCMNTLKMAHSDDATKLIRIRHHKAAKNKLEAFRDVMNLANQEFEATAEQFRALAKNQVASMKDMRTYIKIILKIEDEDEKLSTRTKNQIEKIFNLFEGDAKGSDIPGVRGTWWGAYNAVTEWLNYERGHNNDSRMNSLWFGDSANVSALALETALVMAGITETANAA